MADPRTETASSGSRTRGLLVAALAAGPVATVVGALVAYDADWGRIDAHRGELLLGLVPVAFALAALLSPGRWSRRVALYGGILLLLTAVISSAGLFWLPTAILLIVAGRAPRRPEGRPAVQG